MKVIEALQRQGERRAGGIAPVDCRAVVCRLESAYCTDAGERYGHLAARCFDRGARARRCGETQLVVVAAGERAASLDLGGEAA
jgi:hypothetical protein